MIEQELRKVLDRSVQDTTTRFGGIRLWERDIVLSDDICTVHTTWSHKAVLLMRADRALLTRLAKVIMRSDMVASKDIEDVATEYFNIICGKVAGGLFRMAHISSRFQIPRFYPGSYLPEEEAACRCELNYTSDDHENIQLLYLGPPPLERQ